MTQLQLPTLRRKPCFKPQMTPEEAGIGSDHAFKQGQRVIPSGLSYYSATAADPNKHSPHKNSSAVIKGIVCRGPSLGPSKYYDLPLGTKPRGPYNACGPPVPQLHSGIYPSPGTHPSWSTTVSVLLLPVIKVTVSPLHSHQTDIVCVCDGRSNSSNPEGKREVSPG